MKMSKNRRHVGLSLGLGLLMLTGCQTYYGGMTLPSPHYLKHPPQYFTPDPEFPLQREYDQMLDPEGALRRGVAGPAMAPAIPAPGAVAPPVAAPAPGR